MPHIYLTEEQLTKVKLGLFVLADTEVSKTINNQTHIGRDKIFSGTVHFLSTEPNGHRTHVTLPATDIIDARASLSRKYPHAWHIDVHEYQSGL